MPSTADAAKPDDGREAIAARIAELALAHGMKVAKTPDLPALLASLRVSDPIPIAALGVIAEVLFAILSAEPPQQTEEAAP